jgi:hypothetical protein
VDCLVRVADNRVLSARRMNLVLLYPTWAAGAFYTASRRKEGPKLTEAAGVGMLLNTAGEVLHVCSILMCATDETRPEHVCCKDRKDLAARA